MLNGLDQDFIVLHEEATRPSAIFVLVATGAKSVILIPEHGRDYRIFPVRDLQQRLVAAEVEQVAAALTDAGGTCGVEHLDRVSPSGISSPTVIVDDMGPVGILRPAAGERGLRGFFEGAGVRRPVPSLLSRFSGDAGTGIADALLERSIEAALPEFANLGERLKLAVSIRAESAGFGNLAVKLPAGAEILVFVEARDALSTSGESHCCFRVTDPQEDTLKVFSVDASSLGVGTVRVSAFWGSAPLGSLQLRTVVGEGRVGSQPPPESHRAIVEISARLDIDLSLFVRHEGNQLRFWLQSGDGRHMATDFGSTELVSQPEQYFRNFFDGIDRFSCDTVEARQRVKRELETRGADLASKILPQELRRELWGLRNDIKTVIILSRDPWIPWELCSIEGMEGERVVGSFFLAEQFQLGRWYSGTPAAPIISLRDIALVAPKNADLKHAQLEREFLLSLRGQARQVSEIPATFMRVTSAMEEGRYDGWHFVGHSRVSATTDADSATFDLDDSEKLSPMHVSGRYLNVRLPRPFVFLNSCQSGRAGISLTRPGGWAHRFVGEGQKGASVFVGSYWRVFDDAALAFSRRLYELLLQGEPIGSAVRGARLAIRDMDQLSWMAYTVHAHPLARIR